MDLISLNEQGLFPGPEEREELFFLRTEAVKNSGASRPSEITKKLFHASPGWVEIRESSKGLRPWEAAAAWIEEDPQTGRRVSIQIKNSFLSRFYSLEETIAHEMVHAMRLMFDEKRFEEILAFRTSKNRFRRYFGPLFSKPRESLGFVLLLAVSWACSLAEVMFDLSLETSYLLWAPIGFLAVAAARLARSQRVFSKALEHLEKAAKQPDQALAVALRLTDREIERFAKCEPQEIVSFAAEQKKNNLRWRLLSAAYF
jgi:hypothetical protein